MGTNRRRLTTLLSIFACLITIMACSIPIGQKTEAPTEEVVAPPVGETEEAEESEVFIPLVEGGEDETEAETEAPEVEEATATPEPPTATAIPHVYLPGEPGWVSKYFYDTDSSTTAASKSAAGGDDYYDNKYERPFSQTDMVYYPDLDILKAEISHDDNFFYISITVKGLNPTTGGFTGTFGAELDTDLDGRGDYLLFCDVPNFTEWKIDTAHAFKDTNNDVGAKVPTYPDTSNPGDGYDQMIFSPSILDDPDGLWCRQRAGAEIKVDLAIHKPLVGNPGQFAWGVWTDLGLKQPGQFDYNDHYTFDQAGSPMAGNSYYPLKAIHSLDNTCREAFGFEPSVEILGMCFVPTPTPEPTNTQVPKPGNIRVQLFWDTNQDGDKDLTESYFTGDTRTFRLRSGSCSDSGPLIGEQTGSAVTWTGLPAGPYCLSVTNMKYITTSLPMNVTIISSSTIGVNIGYLEIPY
jgi:hypothetical protein